MKLRKLLTNNKLPFVVTAITGLMIASNVYGWGGPDGKHGKRDPHGSPMASEYRLTIFSEFDANNDKVIDKAEFKKGVAAREKRLQEYEYITDGFFEMPKFDFFDDDQNGKLTLKEFGPRSDKRPLPFHVNYEDTMFFKFDANNDKFLSKAEFAKGMKERDEQLEKAGFDVKNEIWQMPNFTELDENKDGKVSEKEFEFGDDDFMEECADRRYSKRPPPRRWK